MTPILCEKLRICAAELRDGLGRTLIGDTADEAADTIEELVEALTEAVKTNPQEHWIDLLAKINGTATVSHNEQ